jgi:hypothetical protein
MSKKYTVKTCSGYWVNEPLREFSGVRIALEEWDGLEDLDDEGVFYYMDNQPLEVGTIIADSFTVSHIE